MTLVAALDQERSDLLLIKRRSFVVRGCHRRQKTEPQAGRKRREGQAPARSKPAQQPSYSLTWLVYREHQSGVESSHRHQCACDGSSSQVCTGKNVWIRRQLVRRSDLATLGVNKPTTCCSMGTSRFCTILRATFLAR